MYFSSNEKLETYLHNNQSQIKRKQNVYSTIIYVPTNFQIDFGPATWPSAFDKNKFCLRVLFIQGWTDAKFGFIGGKVEHNETIIDALNREFLEETGSEVNFTMNDYLFSSLISQTSTINHIFVKTTNDLNYFQSILINFHQNSSREAYMNECFTLTALPLFIEGPINSEDYSWQNNVWGLPRYLTAHGGFLTPTSNNTYHLRNELLFILILIKLIDLQLLKRIIELSNLLTINDSINNIPLKSYEEFLILLQSFNE